MKRYQLILQLPEYTIPDFKTLIAIEAELVAVLAAQHEVDGQDVGSGTINYFVYTCNPAGAFRQAQGVFAKRKLLDKLRAAYREVVGEVFTNLWPQEDRPPFNYTYLQEETNGLHSFD